MYKTKMGGDLVFMKNKYVLTYEMKILYCPDVDLNLACKELNLSTLQFMLYDGDREDLNNGFELYPNEVTTIAESILMGKVGYELDSKQMEWMIIITLLCVKSKMCILQYDTYRKCFLGKVTEKIDVCLFYYYGCNSA